MELRNLFRRKRPPVLYKYFPPERIDVLQNGQLRFTQTLLFNDPFESSPSFSELAPKTLMQRVSKIEAARTGMPEEERQRILAFIYAEPENRTRLLLVGRLLIEALARGVGILSLTESADSFLMWAHYAKSHEGFVIGFKTTDPFFSRSGARRDAVHDFRKVRYSKRRPKLKFLTSLDLAEMYFTKSSEWKYEEEWRMSTILPEDDFRSVLEVGLGVSRNQAPLLACRLAPLICSIFLPHAFTQSLWAAEPLNKPTRLSLRSSPQNILTRKSLKLQQAQRTSS